MCTLMGGRAAEEIINGEPASGAINDLERLTRIAYGMVQYYGMSERVGELSFYDSTGARGYDLTKPYSEKTAEIMDQEVKEIVSKVHERTVKLLENNMAGFKTIAEMLLDKEVIFASDIEAVFGPKVRPEGYVPEGGETESGAPDKGSGDVSAEDIGERGDKTGEASKE
jgi:AFG3 family protein